MATTERNAQGVAMCHWNQQEDGYACFNTGCGHEYTVFGGEDGEVDIPYCPYCAQRIETTPPPAPYVLASTAGHVRDGIMSPAPAAEQPVDVRAAQDAAIAKVAAEMDADSVTEARGVEGMVLVPRKLLDAVLERDGGKACRCIGISRDAEQEYETGTCPHQRLAAALAGKDGAK